MEKQDRSFLGADPAIVNPVAGKNSPAAGPLAVMVSSETDLTYLAGTMTRDARDCRNFLMSRYYWQADSNRGGLLIGPVIGAPYAAMLLENLIAWGTRQLIFFGWGGAVAEDVRIGDIILPTGAMSDEGTSRHYGYTAGEVIQPSRALTRKIGRALGSAGLHAHRGPVWTTDAIYRETAAKVDRFRRAGALAVEMELAALFAVARFRGIEAAAVLAVSDELSLLKWRAGFGDKRFKQARRRIVDLLAGLPAAL